MGDRNPSLVRFAPDASDEEILAVVRRWSDTLAVEDYEAALAMVHAPDWTVDSLRDALQTHDGWRDEPGAPHKVTPLATASYRPGDEPINNPWPRQEVDRSTLPSGEPYISVWFDLPLDGYWSDLTATFDLDRHGDQLVLTLAKIHVM